MPYLAPPVFASPAASPWFHRLRLIAFALSAFLLATARLSAQSQHGSLYYSVQVDYVLITGCVTATTGEITVPEAIDGLPVKILGPDCFDGSNASVIRLPASLIAIFTSAFRNCRSLTAIEVSAANPEFDSVGGVMFSEDRTRIWAYPGGLGGIYTVPDGVKEIVQGSFHGNDVLTGLSLPSSLQKIGGAFFSCDALEAVVIPEGVTEISSDAFSFCKSLKSVSLPESLKEIGILAFMGCDLEEIEIPAGDIGQYAFASNARLSKIRLGAGVKSVGLNAFAFCPGSQQIVFPASLQSLAPAFEGWTQLTSAVFLGDAPAVDEGAFDGASPGLTVYYFPGAQGFSSPEWEGYPAFPIQAPAFTSALPLATAPLDVAFSHRFTATGLPAPGFALTAGALPDGLTLDAYGHLSGTPTAMGTFTGTVTASNGFTEAATQSFSIVIGNPPPVVALPNAIRLSFPTVIGKTYRVKASEDLEDWAVIEDEIQGTGGLIQRTFSTLDQEKRFFVVEDE